MLVKAVISNSPVTESKLIIEEPDIGIIPFES
jgi:hypothetical protein